VSEGSSATRRRRLPCAGKCANIVPVLAPTCGRGWAKGHRETVNGQDDSSGRLAAHLPSRGRCAVMRVGGFVRLC
jgi:hypothetical protein